MKKGYFIFISALLVLLLSTVPAGAAEDSNVITLDEAKELALAKARSLQNLAVTQDKLEIEAKIAYDKYFGTDIDNNIDGYTARIKQLNLQINQLDPVDDAAEIAAMRAKIEQIEAVVSSLKAARPSTTDLSSGLRMQWRATEYAYEDMDKTISDAEKQLQLTVESLYFGLLNTQNTIELQEKNLELLGAQLKVERLKLELGLSTKLDEKNVALQYDSLYKMLDDLENARQITVWRLNDMMGREIDSELVVVAEQITPVLTMVDSEEVLDNALKNSLSIAAKKREIEDYDDDARKESDSYKRSSLKYSKEIAEIELADMIENAKVTVKSLIENLGKSYRDWENKNLAKANAESAYQSAKVKYELGLIAKLQFMSSEAAYRQALNEELAAAQNWYLARNKIQLAKEGILLTQ